MSGSSSIRFEFSGTAKIEIGLKIRFERFRTFWNREERKIIVEVAA